MLEHQVLLDRNICKICTSGNCYSDHKINIHDVKKAITFLKKGKRDGNCEMDSEHLIYGSNQLHVHISMLFQSMLTHGFSPNGFLESVIVPIPKSKRKSLSDIKNYRGISLSSMLGKVMDNIIVSLHSDVLHTIDMQFGFKVAHSTTQCSFVVEEIVHYHKSRGSNVFLLLLDASQAFDRVNYVKMFTMLSQRGLCSVVLRWLSKLYCSQSISIKWGNCTSSKFHVTNGVKQGGVLSPLLFAVYIDKLLVKLKKVWYWLSHWESICWSIWICR